MPTTWNDWLRRLRHDLVKRMLWPARDRKETGGPVRPGELAPALIDDEGRPTTVEELWASLREVAPEPTHQALSMFQSGLSKAADAARRDEVAGVLALESAFERLAQDLARERS